MPGRRKECSDMALPDLHADHVIVGHGLAGATLAWTLHLRGCRVLVIDRAEAVTASRVAAGIVTPITGQRVALGWRVATFWPEALAFYGQVAALLGVAHFRELPHVRFLRTPDEERRWIEKSADPAFRAWLANPEPCPLVPPSVREGPAFAMRSGWLDVAGWLDASRAWLRARDALLVADAAAECRPAADHVLLHTTAGDIRAGHVIFCQGHEACRHPLFAWLRWKSAKGEILDLRIPDLVGDRILNRGGWLLPTGGGTFRAGSGYEWQDLTAVPTAAGRHAIEQRLADLLTLPWAVTGHAAAVRPIIRESRAVIGTHPVNRRVAFFNGLGSKGVLHAPHAAAALADHLLRGTPVDSELDLCRND